MPPYPVNLGLKFLNVSMVSSTADGYPINAVSLVSSDGTPHRRAEDSVVSPNGTGSDTGYFEATVLRTGEPNRNGDVFPADSVSNDLIRSENLIMRAMGVDLANPNFAAITRFDNVSVGTQNPLNKMQFINS